MSFGIKNDSFLRKDKFWNSRVSRFPFAELNNEISSQNKEQMRLRPVTSFILDRSDAYNKLFGEHDIQQNGQSVKGKFCI